MTSGCTPDQKTNPPTEHRTEPPSEPQHNNLNEKVESPSPDKKTQVELQAKLKSDPKVNWLAQLKERKKDVDYRLHNESIWKKAPIDHTFDRFDAVQTQNASNAKILYQSGSQLDVNENTLLIFDHDPGLPNQKSPDKKEDRIIIKNGELTGATKTELWVFTNAGLVQIKAPTGKKTTARAKISIPDGKKLNVQLSSGSADLIYVKNNNFAKLKIGPNSDVQIMNEKSIFSTESIPDESKLKALVQAAAQIKTSTKTALIIDSPKDGATTETKTFEIKGHLTDFGGKLIINGAIITILDDLTFTKKIELSEGANLIVFQLIRSDGSVEFLRRSLKLNTQE